MIDSERLRSGVKLVSMSVPKGNSPNRGDVKAIRTTAVPVVVAVVVVVVLVVVVRG